MANYARTTWATGDTITATKLNNVEEGLNNLTIAGTANQVLVNGGTSAVNNAAITLTLPQSIGTASSLQLASASLGVALNGNWGAGQTPFQIGGLGSLYATTAATAGGVMVMGNNLYYDGTNSRYLISSEEATRYFQLNGGHFFQKAPTGTAADIIAWVPVVQFSDDRALLMGNGDNSDPAAQANYAGIFTKDVTSSAELFGIDEAGNKPQLTPHNFGLFEPDPSYEYPWSYYCANDYLGVEIGVDMFGAIRALEALTGKQFIHMRNLPQKRDWHADQQARVAKREAEIAAAQEKNANRKPDEALVEVPNPYVPKAPPKWLADRLN